MIVNVELPPEIETDILAEARQSGLAVEAYVQQILCEHIGIAPGPSKARSQSAGERIRELRKGVALGGIPVRELIEEGRE